MIVQCPQCSTRFRLDPRRLGDRGAKVTCSVCSHSFVVAAKADPDELDPFATTSIDDADAPFSPHDAKTAVHQVPAGFRMRPPAELDSARTALDLPGRNEQFGVSDYDARTAPHEMPRRQDTRPDQRSAASLLGDDFLPRYPDDDPTQADDVAVVADDDIATIDEGDFQAVDEDEIDMDEQLPARVPQRLQHEISQAPTTVAQVPSLMHESPREESKIHRLTFESPNTVVAATPSLERPLNAAHQQALKKVEIGAATFVGKIDPAILRAARSPTEELDPLQMTGGLSADGTYTPPQELTRPAIVGFGGLEEQPKTESRRITRQIETVGLEERAPRPTGSSPLDVSATTRFMRGAVTAAMMVGLTALGLFALVRSGQLDIEVLKDPELIVHSSGVTGGSSGVDGVAPVELRSLVYPTSRGGAVLVFAGEVKNTGAAPVENLDVVAELRDASGSLIATAREPLGAVLTVAELASLDDQASIDRAFAAKQAKGVIAGGAQIPYMVVMAPVPRQLRTGRHLVRLVQRPAEPPVVSAPALTPSLPAVDDETQDDAALRKAKMKAKRMKMKRRGQGADDASGAVDTPTE